MPGGNIFHRDLSLAVRRDATTEVGTLGRRDRPPATSCSAARARGAAAAVAGSRATTPRWRCWTAPLAQRAGAISGCASSRRPSVRACSASTKTPTRSPSRTGSSQARASAHHLRRHPAAIDHAIADRLPRTLGQPQRLGQRHAREASPRRATFEGWEYPEGPSGSAMIRHVSNLPSSPRSPARPLPLRSRVPASAAPSAASSPATSTRSRRATAPPRRRPGGGRPGRGAGARAPRRLRRRRGRVARAAARGLLRGDRAARRGHLGDLVEAAERDVRAGRGVVAVPSQARLLVAPGLALPVWTTRSSRIGGVLVK